MGYGGDIGPDGVADRMPGERLPGGSADKTECRGGRDDAYLVTRFAQDPQQGARLVGSDAPRDAEDDARAQVSSSSTTATTTSAAGS